MVNNSQARDRQETPTSIATNDTSQAETSDNSSVTPLPEQAEEVNLPSDFPPEIPVYPQATLLSVEEQTKAEQGKTNWRSPDSSSQIVNYYQQQFKAEGWKIVQPFSADAPERNNTIIASKDNLEVTLSLSQPTIEAEGDTENTEFTIGYRPVSSLTQLPTKDLSSYPEQMPSSSPLSDSQSGSTAASYFTDLGEVPEQLRQYVEDVAALGILSPYKKDGEIQPNKFAPNEPVTRRDYARWLVQANNKFYANSPGNEIHLAKKASQPAYQDISENDPDFSAIQGLAEAGLIPSMLTNDGSKLLFRPDAPLTREDLLSWKVPLDLRKALSSASIETIKESWGFQDAADINSQGLQALFADFQNGEQANVRRIFGYTTIFQPKKTVTRAEAAASLWYFGFQGDGINAKEVFQAEKK
ncbi:S-layer homology domain-containing protein [Pleurocapsales cyanobacterium LEGE 06147]|nr:S-layer homology domain-containing protein [Pleurocapsales cyanobacterium LEGE 06147]